MCCKRDKADNSYGFGYYGNNAAAPAVKVVPLKVLREKVNEKLFEMEIENFFPGDGGFCGEEEDAPLKRAGRKAIKETYRELRTLQRKRYDEETESIHFKKSSGAMEEEKKEDEEDMDMRRSKTNE